MTRLAKTVARQHGFTLVELVMVIAIAGLVAVLISTVMSNPLQSFVDQSRRAELVDKASMALNRMARDIRLAVPNSVRVRGSSEIEMLNVLDAGRYRPNRVGGDGLQFAPGTAPACTASFNALSGLGQCSAFQVLASGLNLAGARWLVVYNIGAQSGGNPVAGANVWAGAGAGAGGAHVITPDGSNFAATSLAGNETLLTVTPPAGGSFNFAYASPQRRFYLADQIVGYRCDLVSGQLLRFTRSARTPAYSGSSALQASHVTGCSLTYQPGSTQRAALVNLRLQLTLEGESIELFQQVHVDNAP